jgi:hypothetical protein
VANLPVFRFIVLLAAFGGAAFWGFAGMGCSSVRPRLPSLETRNSQWEADHALIIRSKRLISSGQASRAEAELMSFLVRVTGRRHPLEGVALFYFGEAKLRNGEINHAHTAFVDAWGHQRNLPLVYAEVFVPSRLFATYTMLGQADEAAKLLPRIAQGLNTISGQLRDLETFAKSLAEIGFLPEIVLTDEQAWDAIRLGQFFLFRAFETSRDRGVKIQALEKFKNWHAELQKKLDKPWSLLAKEDQNLPSPEVKSLEQKLVVLSLAHGSLIDLSRYQIAEGNSEFDQLIEKLLMSYETQIEATAKRLPLSRRTSPQQFSPKPLGL